MTKYYNEGWFGKHPNIYEFASRFMTKIRNKAAQKMGVKKLNILDIATGTGAHAFALAKLKHSVTGIDLDRKMLDKAKKKITSQLQLKFNHGDGTKLNYKDNEYDAATISFAMHDVPYDIGLKIILEAKRVISQNGFIFIVDYNDLSSFGSRTLYLIAQIYETPNYKPFVKMGLSTYLASAGFEITDKSTFLGAVQYVTANPI